MLSQKSMKGNHGIGMTLSGGHKDWERKRETETDRHTQTHTHTHRVMDQDNVREWIPHHRGKKWLNSLELISLEKRRQKEGINAIIKYIKNFPMGNGINLFGVAPEG